jgi:hypothetical protein
MKRLILSKAFHRNILFNNPLVTDFYGSQKLLIKKKIVLYVILIIL